ncbi:hypothetical protein SAMN05444483_101727 [Salegentibacter echinorum]|uniref:Uncharacterized protein n=1 Tax=Salegentibacter echinorum TaxID=1073325 RepID=A0A1M5CYW4_SALEC|nr:hypothetical protein SAMN05444483_101727 [Salegentibacter echinorum]
MLILSYALLDHHYVKVLKLARKSYKSSIIKPQELARYSLFIIVLGEAVKILVQ